MSESVLQAIGTFALGVVSTIVGKKLAEAKLEVANTSTNFLLPSCVLDVENVLKMAPGPKGREMPFDVLAYRVRVRNKHKLLLNVPAKNCVAWLEINGAPETYQLCWVGSKESVTINVGDSREVDVCAIAVKTGIILAPTENGYVFPTPRRIGHAGLPIKGLLRVTCENGDSAERSIGIEVGSNNDNLRITLS